LTQWSEPQTAVLLTGHPDLVGVPPPPRIEIEVKELEKV
jgi:NAD(P)H-quinone oxidoreductase subunit 4